MKYRKKPVVIEAIEVDIGYRNLKEIISFVGKENLCPIERHPNYILKIKTLEGDMAVNYGDYIIKGIKGEFYPCKPDIFAKLHDKEGEKDKDDVKNKLREMIADEGCPAEGITAIYAALQSGRIADALEDLAVLLKDDQRQKVSKVVTEGIKKQVLGRRNKGGR